MLELRNISMSYEGSPLLSNISFRLDAGETLALLGLSGSGKTTLLRIIAGLEIADSGAVYWDGKSLDGTPVEKRNFGMVFQDYALFPHLNVAENIGFGLRAQGVSREKENQRITEILDLINLSGWERKRVDVLSGGEQQRVALGRALAVKPKLLMLDEPLNALDKMLREELAGEIRRILDVSKTPAIYVTHDQEEAFAIASRVAILHDGKILQDDSPQVMLQSPKHEWVVDFLGLGTVLEGTRSRKKIASVQTALGTFRLAPLTPLIRDGERILVMLRAEDGQLRVSKPRGAGWIAGTVTRKNIPGRQFGLKIILPPGVEIMCESKENILVGQKVWWRNELAYAVRILKDEQ
jgi:spermidine/putrescine transport system ATP-binding protein